MTKLTIDFSAAVKPVAAPLPTISVPAGNTVRTYSPQQLDCIEFARNGRGSCVVEAVAGSGKTTTLLQMAKVLRGQVAIIAFNKPVADEIKAKLLAMDLDWRKAQGGTVHSFGFSAFKKTFGKEVAVDGRKVRDIIDDMVSKGVEMDRLGLLGGAGALPRKAGLLDSCLMSLVSMAKQRGLGLVGGAGSIEDDAAWLDIIRHFEILAEEDVDAEDEEFLRKFVGWGRQVLLASNAMTSVVDFDDMIYLALLHKCRIWQFDSVIIDEAQDTNVIRRLMARAMCRRGGRMFAFGDRHQGIYGFTGADADALDLLREEFGGEELPLTVSFRCPQAVVRFAQQWVSHIEAAPGAVEGVVRETDEAGLFEELRAGSAGSAVLCRVTRPLVALAFACIRARIPCRIEGRKDVGERLVALATRWKVRSIDDLEGKLDDHLEKMRRKLKGTRNEAKFGEIEDVVETLRVVMDQCRREKRYGVGSVVAYIEQLFDTDVAGMLVLSTIHKAKGREWGKVFWLDRRGTCPSRWARQDWQAAQELNLMYVAATRAMSELVEVLLPPKLQLY